MNSTDYRIENGLLRLFTCTSKIIVACIILLASSSAFAAKSFTALGIGSQTGSVTAGTAGSVTYTVTGTFINNGNASCGPLTVTGLPAGVTNSSVTLSANGIITSVSATLTLTTLASTPAVTGSAFTISCTASSGGTYTANGTITVSSATALNHIRISHGGSGLTCAPAVLTIIACANAACTAPHYTAAPVTGSVTWAGSPGGSVPFSITVGGTTQISLPVTTQQTVTLGTTAVSPIPVIASDCINSGGGAACSIALADSGLLLSVPDHVADTSQNITISAIRKSDNALLCVPAFASVTRAINLKCVYTNPGSGTLPVRVGGSALNAVNSAAAACDGTGRSVNFAFDATGVATGTLQYADVGQMTLNATYTGSGATGDVGLSMTGTGSFIAAPASFAFSNITAGLIKAGNAYSASITARNSSNTATPNFGLEAAPEGVTLSPNLVAPVGGNNPAIGNNIISGGNFTSGVANLSNLSWGEVGLITMTAKLTNPTYLGTTFTASGISGNTGPFIPDHFDTVTSAGMVCPVGLTCPTQFNGYVYSGQAFSTLVTAYSLGGSVTQNYDTTFGYSKAVTLSAMNALGGATTNPSGGTLTINTISATAFNLGVANTNTPVYTFPVSLTAPTDIYIRAIDTDSVSSLRTVALNSIEGGMKIVSGRSKISNAYGSELLPLTQTVNVQFWNGVNWASSTTDSTTQFNSNLSSAAGNIVPTIVTGPLALGNISVASPGLVTVVAGAKAFTLNKPSVTGSVDLKLNAPSYLYTGSNNAAIDPSIAGRATFGVYSGNTNLIYQREAY
jgi:MSHA biogenesis protein MshQ